MKLPALAACVSLAWLPSPAVAMPTGGQVVAGDVSIASAGTRMDITQRGNAGIVNWADFGIGAGGVVNIHQAADAALLNRVVGANPSQLLGQLNAAGRVYLVNPNGVLVGPDARIDAGSFFATTAQIGDAAFLAGGGLAFSDGTDAGIVNLGVIRATTGDAVLVAHRVVNGGEMHAPSGVAALGAATEFIYSPYGDERVRIVAAAGAAAPADGTGVDNRGLVDAAEARLLAADGNLYELAVNQTGVVRATGVERRGGRVLLTATGGTVAVTGEIAARNADGSGGEVLVGGDYQGANAAVPNAAFTRVGADAVIDVAATSANGDGGRAIVWADERADFAGFIDGRAGTQGGDGGFAEVSGKRVLNFAGSVNLTAPFGRTGNLLLDPISLEIRAAGPETDPITLDADLALFGQRRGTETSILLVSTLEAQLALSNVTLDTKVIGPANGSIDYGQPPPAEPVEYTDGSIMVSAPIAWSSGNRLTFDAGNSIYVNADINAGAGSIEFILGPVADGYADSFYTVPALTSDLVLAADATLTANTIIARRGGLTENSFAFEGPGGSIDLRGVVNTDILEIGYQADALSQYGGFLRAITVANAANRIGTLRANSFSGLLQGDVTIVDSEGGLTVEGPWVAGLGAGIQISTVGDLTLAAGVEMSTGLASGIEDVPPYADIVLAAQGGRFINQAGADALNPTGTGRFLIYSADPADDNRGGLAGTPVYNKTFAANAPGTITQTGNRFLYSLPATLTFTASSESRLYGSENPALTFTVSGLVGADTAALAYAGTPLLATDALASSNAGNIPINISAGTVVASDYDYQLVFAPGTLTINPAPLTITADNKSRNELEANPELTATFAGLVNDDTSADFPGLTLATAATIDSLPGDYAITVGGATNGNYLITYVDGVLVVGGVPVLTIRADDFSIFYGAALPSFTSTISGFNPGDDESLVSNLSFSTTAVLGSNVGAYDIVPSGASATGYRINYVTGTLTINPASLLITANAASRAYGDPNPAFTASFAGLVAGDTAAAFPGLTFATAPLNAAVGAYPLNVSGATNPNYTPTYVPGELTVTPRPVVIAAGDVNAVYGETFAQPGFTITGLASFDTASVLGAIEVFGTGTNAGTYPINIIGGANPNYTVTRQPGTLTIARRPATITANDVTREYGEANPPFYTATYSGFLAGDLFGAGAGFSTPVGQFSDVGEYLISPISFSNAANYDISFVDGVFRVTPAPLILTPASFSRVYGEANPALTFSLTGLKGADTPAVVTGATADLIAGRATPVGDYIFNVTGATAANYTITATTGTVTITPRPITVIAADAARVYGDANPAFTIANADTNLLPDLDPIEEVVRLGTTATVTSFAGNYAITPELLDANYTLAAATTGTLRVSPRPLDVVIDNAFRYFGNPNPTFTYRVVGTPLPAGLSLDGQIVPRTQAVVNAASQSGFYRIINDGFIDPRRYELRSLTPGVLTVAPRPVAILADSITRNYPPGTRLADITDFSEINLQARVLDLLTGDDVTASFPGLALRVFDARTVSVELVREDYAQNLPVPPADRFFNGYAFPGGIPPTEVRAVGYELPSSLAAEGTRRLLGIAPDFDYLVANINYAVTTIEPGRLTLLRPLQLSPNLYEIDQVERAPLVVRSITEYRENVGVWFAHNPDLTTNMVTDYFAGLFESGEAGESELLAAIFGEGATDKDAMNTAAIRAWLGDIDTDPTKRALLLVPFADYARSLQNRDPSTYTVGETHLVDALKMQMSEERTKLADTVRAAQDAWLQSKAGAPNMADMFDGTQPYGDFIKAGVENYMVEAMSGGAIAAVAGGAAAGGAAALGSAAVGSMTAVSAAIFPFHYVTGKAAVAAGVASGASAGAPALTAAGPAAIIVAAVTMSIVRGIQLGENMKEQKDFNAITSLNGPAFAEMNLDPNSTNAQALADQMIFGAALNNMMGGG
ncbi:MAG: filamentous hemagglutinin N-terminal domain-containing protein [Opitutaceae bacterium]|nr:filamentous hemagglutinin N-terminal domain-containing protein [Opitutaceae bacterium]